MYCKNCGTQITSGSKTGLCLACYKDYAKQMKIKHWQLTGDTGCSVATTLRNCIREYILLKQGRKCAICGLADIWNGATLHFILDHIDGNAANNQEDNLRLVCPNCDSQLNTYKSKNKNSARKHRKNY